MFEKIEAQIMLVLFFLKWGSIISYVGSNLFLIKSDSISTFYDIS